MLAFPFLTIADPVESITGLSGMVSRVYFSPILPRPKHSGQLGLTKDYSGKLGWQSLAIVHRVFRFFFCAIPNEVQS